MKQTCIVHRGQFVVCAVVALAVAIFSEVSPARADETAGMTRECRKFYREYRKVATHKAFAASQVIDGLQACGYSFAWDNQKKAINSAMGSCKSAAAYRNLKAAVCRVVKAQ